MEIMKTILGTMICFSVFTGCGGAVQVPSVVDASATPTDLCSPKNLPLEVDKLHKYMREFDDASLLAANTPRDQLPPVISDMQRIRRNVEDQVVPPCLATLKSHMLAHQNTVINTLVVFLGGADQGVLREGAALATAQHNQYALEYARLLGLTIVSPPTGTPTSQVLPTGPPVIPTPTGVVLLNPGPADINLYAQPAIDSQVVAVLSANGTATVLAQSADGLWLQVEIPGQVGQLAWVQSSLISYPAAAP